MSGNSAVLIKRQMKFKSAIYLNVAAITIAFLLYLERVLKSEASGSDLHLFIILISLINCFKSYKSMMRYEAFYKQMNDQYKTEMQNAEHFRKVHLEFEEFMKLNNEEPEQKTWNSKMNTSISIIYLTLLGTYALTKIFQDHLLDDYKMINNLWLYISFLISMRYLIFDEQNVAECMNQDIRNFKERMEKYSSENFSNLLDIKHEIRKDSCHGDVRSKITLEEKKQSSRSDKNINHENENCYESQETTYNKFLNLNISDCRAHEAETSTTEKEETAEKSDTDLQVIREQECRLQLIENMREKDIVPLAFNQDRKEKELKQNEEHRNSVSKNNIIEQRETNIRINSTSDPSTNEAETEVAVKENTLIKPDNKLKGLGEQNCPSTSTKEDGNIRGMGEKKNKSEMIANWEGEDSEKGTNLSVSIQDHREKDIKQTVERGTLVSDDKINEQRESNKRKSSPSDPSTNEAETDVAEHKTSIKTDDNLQWLIELKGGSEKIANHARKDSEKDNNLFASPKDSSEKDIKLTKEQRNLFPDDIIEQTERNNNEPSLTYPSTSETETDTAGVEKVSIKTGNNVQGTKQLNGGSETVANGAVIDSEENINLGATPQDHSAKDIKQPMKQEIIAPDGIIEQRETNKRESSLSDPSTREAETDAAEEEKTSIKTDDTPQGMKEFKEQSETIANGAGKDSEKGNNMDASPEDNSEEDIKQTEEQGNLVPDDIIEKRESNNRESSSSDLNTNEAERDTAGEEKFSFKTVNYLLGINKLKHRSETVANGAGKASEKENNLGKSSQDNSEKDMKQTEEQENLVPDDIIEQREINNRKSSPSDPSTKEAETDAAGEEETSIKTDDNLQGMKELKEQSETISNGAGKDSEKGINMGASPEDSSEEDIKQTGEQGNLVPDDIIEKRESNNRESSPSELGTNEAETDTAGEEKLPIKTGKYLPEIIELEHQSETVANGAGKDSEKHINLGTSPQDHSEKDIKQSEEKRNLVPDDNTITEQRERIIRETSPLNSSTNEAEIYVGGEEETLRKAHNDIRGMNEQECSPETIVNVTERFSGSIVDEGATNQGRYQKNNKQNWAQEISISDENIIEGKESNNIQSSSSDRCTHKSETVSAGKDETSQKAPYNIIVRDEENCSSESIEEVRKDSEKDIHPFASNQHHTEENIKENDEQRNSGPSNNIFEQRENNNVKSSSSDLNTDKAERDISGKEKTPIKTDESLQGMDEEKNRSETITNVEANDSEKDINVAATTQDPNEKDIKQTEEQATLVPNHNINEQRESNDRESSPSDLSRNEAETDVAGEQKKSAKTDDSLEGKNVLKDRLETIAIGAGKDSEKDNNLGTSPQGNSEKNNKQTEKPGDFVSDNNINEKTECNDRESSPSATRINEAETNVEGEEKKSVNTDHNLEGRKELNDRSETIANGAGEASEKRLGASPQDNSAKDSKQTEEQGDLVPDDIIEQRESNNRESSPSDPSTKEAEADAAGEEETSIKTDDNLQEMEELKEQSETIANGAGKDSEKRNNMGASPEDSSEEDIKQTEEQGNLVPDDIIEQRESNNRESSPSDPTTNEVETDAAREQKFSIKRDENLQEKNELMDRLETVANGLEKDSEKDINVGALTHKLSEKDIKQTDEKGTLVPDYNINEQRGSNSRESRPSDASTNEAETYVAGEEKTSNKTDDSLKGMKELEVPSETIANGVENDSEKDLGTSPQENNEKDIKQTEKQRNLVPDNNVIAQVESNSRESSRSGPSTEEVETDVAEEKTSFKADDNLQEMTEKKNRSETIAYGAGKYSEKGINLGASTQNHSAKDIKQTEEQGNLVPDDIIEQRERNNMESSPSDLSTNEDERYIAGEGETSIKTDENLQWRNELKDGSETIANEAGKDSQKDNELGAPPKENNEKDIKQIEKHGNFVPDNNANERRESNNSASSPSDAGTNKPETGVAGEEQMSIKSDDSLQEMKELKDQSEMIANRTAKDSEKDNNQGASPQDNSENDIKPTEKQGTLIPDNNIIGLLEGNNREASPSDPSTEEAETFVLGVEKTSINAYGNLQGMVEKKNRYESVANGEGKDSVKVIYLSASPQDHSEKDIKQNEEQGNLVPGYNIFEQRESINRESSLSDRSTNIRVIEVNLSDNGQSTPSTNEAKENFEEETSENGVNNLKETEAKESPLFSQGLYTEKIFRKNYRANKRNFYSNIYSKRNFQRKLKDKKSERDVRFVSGREALKRAVELNICPDYSAGVSKSAGAPLESDTSNQMSSKVEKNIHAENVQINSENEISSPAQQCISEQDANTDTERRLPKSFNSSPCKNRDLQQHINVTVSVNIINKCKPSACGEKACEESEVNEVKRISVDTHINKMGEDMPRISGPNTIAGENYESITPSLSVEDATESKCTSDSKSNFSVLNTGSVKNNSHIKVGVSNIDDQKCERNIIKYEWKSELDQTASNTKEVSEGSGSPDMQTKRMPEQFMESFSIGHDKKKENTSEESFPSKHIASKMEADLGKREYIGAKAEKSTVFIPSIVTGKYMQRNNTNENHIIALDQNRMQMLEGLQEENFADFSQKLSHSGQRAIGTECGQGTDGLCAVKESSNKLKNVIDVKLISVEESSSKAKKREFNSNPSNQNMKYSGSEREVSSSPSMERISEKYIKTISAERRRKIKETSDEVTFSNYAVSNVDKGLKAKESIDTEYGANKQSMNQFVREDQEKYETNEMNVGGDVKHKDATKKKNYTSSKRANIIRNHKEKGYQHSLTNEVCHHHHHERTVPFSSCCDPVNGNRLPIHKGKSLLTKGNFQRYEANLSVRGGMTTTESTPTKDNFIKQNNEHHVVCSDCPRRKDGKNCTVVLHNETLDLTFKTSKSFEIRCKFRPTRENAKVKKSDEESQIC